MCFSADGSGREGSLTSPIEASILQGRKSSSRGVNSLAGVTWPGDRDAGTQALHLGTSGRAHPCPKAYDALLPAGTPISPPLLPFTSMHLKCSVEVTLLWHRPLRPSRGARPHPGTGTELSLPPVSDL